MIFYLCLNMFTFAANFCANFGRTVHEPRANFTRTSGQLRANFAPTLQENLVNFVHLEQLHLKFKATSHELRKKSWSNFIWSLAQFRISWRQLCANFGRSSIISLSTNRLTSAVIFVLRPAPSCLPIVPHSSYCFKNLWTPCRVTGRFSSGFNLAKKYY